MSSTVIPSMYSIITPNNSSKQGQNVLMSGFLTYLLYKRIDKKRKKLKKIATNLDSPLVQGYIVYMSYCWDNKNRSPKEPEAESPRGRRRSL
jgi:hypothetical protein